MNKFIEITIIDKVYDMNNPNNEPTRTEKKAIVNTDTISSVHSLGEATLIHFNDGHIKVVENYGRIKALLGVERYNETRRRR